MFQLNGKVAFITGAGSGIGEEIARAFVAHGATVVIADIDEAAGRRVADDIGTLSRYHRLDVTDTLAVQVALEQTAQRYGSLDVLVNNAGIGLVGSVEETNDEDFERLMKVNVNGVYYGCKHAIPIMLKQGKGNIINIGSVAGLIGIERRFAYCATKGAVIAMTRQLAIDYATRGIRVNCIAPGTVYTPFVESYLQRFHAHELEETKARLHARQPIGRMGTPQDIAAMAVYLACDDSSFVTGAVMAIDGGWTAR